MEPENEEFTELLKYISRDYDGYSDSDRNIEAIIKILYDDFINAHEYDKDCPYSRLLYHLIDNIY